MCCRLPAGLVQPTTTNSSFLSDLRMGNPDTGSPALQASLALRMQSEQRRVAAAAEGLAVQRARDLASSTDWLATVARQPDGELIADQR